MSDLPKEIADMCGILVGRKTQPSVPEEDIPLLNMRQDKDGIYLVTYRDSNVGWIEPLKKNASHPEKYRALSVHGRIGYFWSLDMARTFLMENYH